MQGQRIRSAGVAGVGQAEMVRVSRNGGEDPDRCAVPVVALRNPHWRTERGGDYASLARLTLAGYVDSELVPEFRRGGRHGRGSLAVLVEPRDNDPAVYEALVERAAAFKPSRRYLRKRALLAGGMA